MMVLRATLFLAAFLLFLVQPLAGKILLPLFGGGAAVWNACLLFFQAGLLVGYAMAHGLGRMERKAQIRVHAVLLGLALVWLLAAMRTPEPDWSRDPTFEIIGTLFLLYGPAYLILAMHSPLLQHWQARREPGKSAYHLYAVSNAGSLAALAAYPFLVEPFVAVSQQRVLFAVAFVVLAGLSGTVCVRMAGKIDDGLGGAAPERPAARVLLWWALLAACGSALLMAVTNQMCTEVAPIPFLWVLPLTIYLATYILCFRRGFRFDRTRWNALLAAAALFAVLAYAAQASVSVTVEALALALVLFAGCMSCHGELAEARPDRRHLTLYYLLLTAGGAAGGLFVAVLAPRLFDEYTEFPLLLIVSCALAAAPRLWSGEFRANPLARSAVIGLVLAAGAAAVLLSGNGAVEVLEARRNFYGVLRVADEVQNGQRMRVLRHGITRHGLQLLGKNHRGEPTSYYSRRSGVGIALQELMERNPDRPVRVGVLGQGIGTLAAYGRPGDEFVFYEINPDVDAMARRWFDFMKSAQAKVTVKFGDARMLLEDEARRGQWQQFDLLAVDVFSSGAVPIHLLTVEAAKTYASHIQPEGSIWIHISSRIINLGPVTTGLAHSLRMNSLTVSNARDASAGVDASDWVVLTRNADLLRGFSPGADALSVDREGILWTDDYASLRSLVRFW